VNANSSSAPSSRATGHHIAAWRHPGSQADSGTNIDHYQEVAQLAERGLFDLVFLADSPGIWEGGNTEAQSRDADHTSRAFPPTPRFAESTNASPSRLRLVTDLAEREQLSLRQLYQRLAGARGHWVLVGTPQSIADEMQRSFENEAADGFNIMPPILPESLHAVVELLIPELQRRGLFRTAYEGTTLRENLGLARPESRYARKQSASAAE